MHKRLLATLILAGFAAAASTAATAQTSVTVYGSIDAGLRSLSNTDAAGNSNLTMGSNGTFRSNRLGFKGTEDLGAGLKANFVLETGFNTATGALNNTTSTLFQRQASIGLAGDFGAVDLGRQYTVAFNTVLAYDPFAFKYPSLTYAIASTAGTRNSNDIQYTGKFGGLTARAEYALGEVEGSTSNGARQAVGATYASGPFKLGGAYTQGKENTGSATVPDYRDYRHYTLGGAYTFGAFTASLGHANQKQASATVDDTARWSWAGLSYKATPMLALTGAWYQVKAFNRKASAAVGAGDGKKDLFILGATYSLSKRTTLYAELDRTKLDGSYASGGTRALNQTQQTGFSAGIMHTF